MFTIGNTKFRLRFIPNNENKDSVIPRSDEETKMFASLGVYLYNLSNFDVLADLKLTIGKRSMSMEKKFLRHRECIGRSHQFFLYTYIGTMAAIMVSV